MIAAGYTQHYQVMTSVGMYIRISIVLLQIDIVNGGQKNLLIHQYSLDIHSTWTEPKQRSAREVCMHPPPPPPPTHTHTHYYRYTLTVLQLLLVPERQADSWWAWPLPRAGA